MELSEEENERLSPAEDDFNGDPNGENVDEEEEETKRRVDPSTSKKRIIKNPQAKLNAERLQGPKGIQTIEKYFEGFKYHGKGHEKSDLNKVMKRLEHWAHRLFPKYRFDDFIEKMEILGTKKNVQVFLKKYRLDMITTDEDIVDGTVDNDIQRCEEAIEQDPIDEFDKLIAEQIEKQRANETIVEAPVAPQGNVLGSADTAESSELSDEIKARIEANKKLAMERKMARMKRLQEEKARKEMDESRKPPSTVMAEHRMQEDILDNVEKIEERETNKNKRQKLESPQEQSQIEPQIDNGNSEKEINVQKCNDIESSEIAVSNPKSNGALDVTGTSEISGKTAEATETEGGKNEKSVPRSEREDTEAATDDSERLLTHEELLMAIDGAMEEIIGKKKS